MTSNIGEFPIGNMLQSSRRLVVSARTVSKLYSTLVKDSYPQCVKCPRGWLFSQNVHPVKFKSKQPSDTAAVSLPRRWYCDKPEARSINPAAEVQSRIFYFDTLALVNKLKARGFTNEQAEALTNAFLDIINSTIEHQTKTMVTKPQQEITIQQLMAHIGSVKKDMVILEKSEFSMLRSETEKQTMQIKQFQQHLQDEMSKLKNNVVLDINLERSRSTEAHAENQKELQVLHNKIVTDTAALHTKIETYRNDVFKYAAGAVAATATLCVGLLRLWL